MWTAWLFALHSSKETIVTRLFIFVREKNPVYKNVKLSWCYIKFLSHFTYKYITKQFRNSAHNLYRLGPLFSCFLCFSWELYLWAIVSWWHRNWLHKLIKVSVNVIFSTLIRIFVSLGIVEGKLWKNSKL